MLAERVRFIVRNRREHQFVVLDGGEKALLVMQALEDAGRILPRTVSSPQVVGTLSGWTTRQPDRQRVSVRDAECRSSLRRHILHR